MKLKEYFAVTYSLSKKKIPGDDNKLYSINRNNTLEEICMYNMHNIYDRKTRRNLTSKDTYVFSFGVIKTIKLHSFFKAH